MSEDAASPTLWVDADACPRVIRDILCRAAQRVQLPLVFVANHALGLPPSPFIRHLQVERGFDVADDVIAQRVQAGDFVVTSDIPLAAEVIARGGEAVTPRGERFTRDNVRQRLNMRDFIDTLRASNQAVGGGPPALSERDKQAFANALDRYLARQRRD